MRMTGDLIQRIDTLKDAIDSYRPFSPHLLGQIKDYYRIGMTYSSNALEGNTLTETETKVVLEDGITIGGKSIREHEEAVGHARAYDHMASLLHGEIREEAILLLHRLFFERIEPAHAGIYRMQNVIITGTDYIPPDYPKVPILMKSHLARINDGPGGQHPILWASDLHGEFESIHPFSDGNGRIGRLVLSLLCLKHGYCPVIIPPVKRAEYISAMQKANKEELGPLRDLVSGVVYEEMKALKRIVERLIS
ncbi:MAG: Fic family protein [Nitrospirales bacterium]|nr:Fic family protein [Nitrospirales bacterium]